MTKAFCVSVLSPIRNTFFPYKFFNIYGSEINSYLRSSLPDEVRRRAINTVGSALRHCALLICA